YQAPVLQGLTRNRIRVPWQIPTALDRQLRIVRNVLNRCVEVLVPRGNRRRGSRRRKEVNRLNRDVPVRHIQVAPLPEVHRVVRQHPQRSELTKQVHVQCRSHSPVSRSKQVPCLRDLDLSRQERVRPNQNILQVL